MIFSQPLPRVAGLVSKHDFVLDAPASEPSSGLPLSNGDLSASLYGGPGLLALSVRKGDAHVGEIGLQVNCGLRIADCGIRVFNPKSEIRNPKSGEGLPRFPVLLRLYDATACVAFPDGLEIEAFVAATRGLIVLRVRSQGAVPLPAALELSPKYEVRMTKCDPPLSTQPVAPMRSRPLPSPKGGKKVSSPFPSGKGAGGIGPTFDIRHSTFDCDGPFRYLRQDLSASLSSVLCGFVYGARSHTAVREDAILAIFDVPPSGECLILAGVATSQDGPDPTRSARAEVERALPHGYLLLQREHAVWWERFWSQIEAKGSKDTNYRDIYRSKVSSPRSQVQSQNP